MVLLLVFLIAFPRIPGFNRHPAAIAAVICDIEPTEQPKAPPPVDNECRLIDGVPDAPVRCEIPAFDDCRQIHVAGACKRECWNQWGEAEYIVDHIGNGNTVIWEGDSEIGCWRGWVTYVKRGLDCVCLSEGMCPDSCVSADAPLCEEAA